MRTSLISLLFLSTFAYGQEPIGMENYISSQDSTSSFHLDIISNERVIYTYILYDSLDGLIPEYNLDQVWFEYNRILNLNQVSKDSLSVFVTEDYDEENLGYYFTIFDLMRGFEHEQLKTLGVPNMEDVEVQFGFNIEYNGWTYNILVFDEFIYCEVICSDLAIVRKFEKKYPEDVVK